jgi:N-acetylglutamate synthase-like GNAT family acetyltransferase
VEISSLGTNGESLVSPLVELVDSVFLVAQGKTGSIAKRYPNLFETSNWNNIYCAMFNRRLAGCVFTRPFEYVYDGEIGCSSMVGLVCVGHEVRGHGIGKHLMSFVTEALVRSSRQATLWTTIPEYYSKLGWTTIDRGVLGVLRSSNKHELDTSFSSLAENIDRIESIRNAWLDSRVVRRKIDYQVVPTAVSTVRCIVEGNDPNESAYVLLGKTDCKAYIYEMVGNPSYFSRFVDRIKECCEEAFVNDYVGSPSYRWFSNVENLEWKRQKLGMCLNIGCDSRDEQVFHIPFFDRI